MSAPAGGSRRGLGGAVAIMFSGTFVSRGLGFVRAAVLTLALGSAGGAADAFTVANNLPNTIYMLIAGGVINAVLVPQLVRAARDPDGGQDFANRLLTVAGTALLALTVLLTVGAPLLVRLYANSLAPAWLPIAYAFAFWCIPQVFFYGLYTLLGQVLNARNVFGPYMWAPVLNNVVALGGLAAYLSIFGGMPTERLEAGAFGADRIALLGATATLGVALQALVLVIPLWRSGFRYRPAWGLQGLRTAGTMGGWTFGALLVGQVGVIAVSNVAAAASGRAVADGTTYGGNMAYSLAFTVFMLPQSLVVVSLITAMFTRLSEHAANRDRAAVRSAMSLSVRSVGVFTILAATAMVVLAYPLSRLVTLGQRPISETDPLGAAIIALALGVPGLAIWSVVQRVYFAYQDARSPFWIQVPMMLVVVGVAVASRFGLHPNAWVFGACVGMSLSYTLGALVGYLGLRRRLVHLDGTRIFSTYFRLSVAAVPTAIIGSIVVFAVPGLGLVSSLAQVLIGAVVMAAVYLGLARGLKVTEITVATARLRGILTRVLRPVTERLRTMVPGRRGAAHNVTGESWVLDDTVTSGVLLADRFRVENPLPSTVPGVRSWRGRDTILERDVDILTVGGKHGEDVLDAARRTSLVSDPRVPRVLRVGEHDGTGYIVLESAPPTTLADVLAAGPVAEPVARSIVGEVASGLEAARRRGVYHLHLTPELIAIGSAGEIHVTGIGLAAAARGTMPSSAEAGHADAEAVVALYSRLCGEPVPPEAERDLRTSSNVVIAFAPWAALPPLATLLQGAPSLPAPDDGDDDGPADAAGVADPDAQDEAAEQEADAGPDEETSDAAGPEDEAPDDEARDGEPDDVATTPETRVLPALVPTGAGLAGAAVAGAAVAGAAVAGAAVAGATAAGAAGETTESADPDTAGTDTPDTAGTDVADTLRTAMRRLDALIPAEPVAEPPAPYEPPDSSSWTVPTPSLFTEPAEFDVVVDPAGHGPYGPEDDGTISSSPPDRASTARHTAAVTIGAVAAWWTGRRELAETARQERRVEAAALAEAKEKERQVAIAERAEAERLAAIEHARAQEELAAAAQAARAAEAERAALPTTLLEQTPTTRVSVTSQRVAESDEEQAARDAARYAVPTRPARTWGTINATPIVLILVLAGVLYVAYLAINSLLAPLQDIELPESTSTTTSQPTEPTDDGGTATDDGETQEEEPADEEQQPADASPLGPASLPAGMFPA